jgi:luciferase family oxidoreductase group 1
MLPFSVLDLAPVAEGATPAQALRNSLSLARHAEKLGFQRFWLAEHHNMRGIASAATAVVIGYVAGGTSRIRVGSGGVMLPNHAPLVIAEQFGTLASLYPDRIDLGLGRAPGTDQYTARALRRHLDANDADDFPRDVVELIAYLDEPRPGHPVRAIPGAGTQVPVWILGSSLFGAQLAAYLGLPYAFASHFAPELLEQALQVYRDTYRPSARWPEPHTMVGVNVIAADSDAEGARLLTSLQQRFLGMRRGVRGPLPRPVDSMHGLWSDDERAGVQRMLAATASGGPDKVRRELQAIIQRTGAHELIVASAIHDHAARLRSYEIVAGLDAG